MKAFGQINSDPNDSDKITVGDDAPEIVPLQIAGASHNVAIVPNGIKIEEAGYYLLSYSVYLRFTATAPVVLTLAVRSREGDNEENIDQTVSTASAPPATFSASYTGSTIAYLSKDTVIYVTVASTSPVAMSFDTGTISSLVVYKLD